MIVSAAKIVLDFWGNEDLKDKKKLMDTLSEKLESAHHLRLTEVGSYHDLERCELGLCFCSTDIERARARMKKILEFLDASSAARIVAEDADFQVFP